MMVWVLEEVVNLVPMTTLYPCERNVAAAHSAGSGDLGYLADSLKLLCCCQYRIRAQKRQPAQAC